MSLKGWLALRIFDRVAGGQEILESGRPISSEMLSSIRKAANTYVRLVADEAAQFQSQTDRYWDITKGDFGFLRPPFERMWLEYKMPNLFFVDNEWKRATPPGQRYAALISQRDDDSWNMVTVFANGDHGDLNLFPVIVDISGASNPSEILEVKRFTQFFEKFASGFPSREAAVSAALGCLIPAYLTIGWLNCRGIRTEVSAIGHRRKSAGSKRRVSGLDYRRIILDWKTRQVLERNRAANSQGKRLHVVRGHIRHYTAERPGFGNYVGNMWIHPHTRGDAAVGRINHEYHVQARGSE